MDDVKVLNIQESPTVGRWVLATIGGYDDSVYRELTFAQDIRAEEWEDIFLRLPLGFLVVALRATDGVTLGRKHALLATIA